MPKNRPMSAREWSERLGYKSPQSISMILSGERLPSRALTHKLAKELNLGLRETRYFELLIDLKAAARRGQDTRVILDQLEELHPAFLDHVTVDEATFKYMSEWFCLVIKQLIGRPDFVESPEWIAGQLGGKISLKDAEVGLKIIENLGLAVRENGKLKPAKDVRTTQDVPSEAIKLFHSQMLDRAKEALREQSVEDREIQALTLQMPASRVKEAKDEVRKFMRSFNEKFFDAKATDVFQLNIQLFNHIRKD
jgi:uncharacterized protein (TIGR02147 family)